MAQATGQSAPTPNALRGTQGDDSAVIYKFSGILEPAGFTFRRLTGWKAVSAVENLAIRAVLDEIETYLDITFIETAGTPDFDMTTADLQASGLGRVTAGLAASAIPYTKTGMTS